MLRLKYVPDGGGREEAAVYSSLKGHLVTRSFVLPLRRVLSSYYVLELESQEDDKVPPRKTRV